MSIKALKYSVLLKQMHTDTGISTQPALSLKTVLMPLHSYQILRKWTTFYLNNYFLLHDLKFLCTNTQEAANVHYFIFQFKNENQQGRVYSFKNFKTKTIQRNISTNYCRNYIFSYKNTLHHFISSRYHQERQGINRWVTPWHLMVVSDRTLNSLFHVNCLTVTEL